MNKYTNNETLYSGPHSIIYRAIEHETNNIVALKVVDVDFCMKPHNVRREIATLQQIHHPGVLSIISLFSQGDDMVLVTPCFQFDLGLWINRCIKKRVKFNLENPALNTVRYNNEFPLEKIGPIFASLVSTVAFLHDQGIIHRDIKPSNVFFMSEDSEPVIGDFGIIYNTRNPPPDEPPHAKITDVSTGIFKAPELCFGLADYSHPIDIWSLGILLTILYSSSGSSCLDDEANYHDLTLINSMFQNFGTPLATDALDPRTYWPDANQPQNHFNKFQFTHYPRKLPAQLLPRCQTPAMLDIFDSIMVYQASERITAKKMVTCLENLFA